MTPARTGIHPARGASFLAVLAGLWFFLSPWIWGVYWNHTAWNSWIAGALIFIFAVSRMIHPGATILSWFNVALGVWTFASPWIFGYVDGTGRFVNSLCVGFIVFCTAIVGANSERGSHHT